MSNKNLLIANVVARLINSNAWGKALMKGKGNLADRPQIIVAIVATACASAVGVAAYYTMHTLYETQPIWVEEAAYSYWPRLIFLSSIERLGLWRAAWQAIVQGERHLLQSVVLGVLSPKLLGWAHAHLLIVMPAFVLFLGLLGWTVYRRTSSVAYSVGAMALYCALPGLASERWGIGAGFADYQSALLLGAAALCLINALMHPGLGWVRGFAVLVSLSALARTTAASFAVVICGPILLIHLVDQYRTRRSLKSLFGILANIFVIAAPIAAIVAWQLTSLLWYYTSPNAWGLRQPFHASAWSILSLLVQFVEMPMVAVCLVLFALGLSTQQLFSRWIVFIQAVLALMGLAIIIVALAAEQLGIDPSPGFGPARIRLAIDGLTLSLVAGLSIFALHLKPIKMLLTRAGIHARLKIGSSELAIGWWAVGFLGFLLLNGYISDAPKEVMYAVPALLLAAVSPVLVRNVQRPSVYPLLAVIMIIFATASFGWNTLRSVQRAATVDPRAAVLRQSQIEMAAALSKLPERIVWQSYTIYDWGIPVSVLTYYKYGEFRGADNTLFHNAKSYWDARYPALSLAELQERLYTQTKERIDVAIVLKDPEKKPEGMEEYSYSIAAYISERVQSDDKWRYHSKLRGEPFGSELAIYVNTDRRDSQALGESVQR